MKNLESSFNKVQNIDINLFKQASLLMENSKEDYYDDFYLPKYKPSPLQKIKNYKFHIDNTINFYCSHNAHFDKNILNELDNALLTISKKDHLVLINGLNILYELYRAIWLIDITQAILKIIENPEYEKSNFAKFNQDNREVHRESNHYKRLIVKPKRPLSSKKESRFKWYLLKMYHYDKKLFNVVFHSLILGDIAKVADIYTMSDDEAEIAFDSLNFFMNQKTNPKDVIKSLGILLYQIFRHLLKMKDTKSKILSVEIIQYLFDKSFNDEEVNKAIYIRSVVAWFPIFGAKRKPQVFNEQEINLIRKQFIKFERLNKPKKQIDASSFNKMMQIYIDYPHLVYLKKYPVEFFRINPKYSHLFE